MTELLIERGRDRLLNLDLGDTIWLNVSRKLLNDYKWFFVPFEKMPKEVFAEFRCHKHMHPPVKVWSSIVEHGHTVELKHHSHTHPDTSVTSSLTSHSHSVSLSKVDCGSGATHGHTNTLPAADSHSHDCVLSFGVANLGSPNWYEHVHPITLSSIGAGGAAHTHGLSTSSSSSFCTLCKPTTHYHGYGTGADASAGTSHTHTLAAINTGNAYSTDTPESHRHSFSISLDNGGLHSHAISGTPSIVICAGDYSHNHTYGTPSTSVSHAHTLSGDSGYGGEVAIVKKIIGDGLTWIVA